MKKSFCVLVMSVVIANSTCSSAGFNEGLSALNTRDFVAALREFVPLANNGHALAQNHLAIIYYNGEGVTQNMGEAVKWFCKSAEQGVASAQYGLGFMYYNGYGVDRDRLEAAKWYLKAADQDYLLAQDSLGFMYYIGEGVVQNIVVAEKWYRKVAEKGVASAQFNLGILYENGIGITQNKTEALIWYRKAAEQGMAVAQYNLGCMYNYGEGVGLDKREAAKWYRKAAEHYVISAQDGLDASGNMVDKDIAREVKYKSLYALDGIQRDLEVVASDKMKRDAVDSSARTVGQKNGVISTQISAQDVSDKLKYYRYIYSKSKTYNELWTFIRLYADYDPDKLVVKANAVVAIIEAVEAKKKAAEEKKDRAVTKKIYSGSEVYRSTRIRDDLVSENPAILGVKAKSVGAKEAPAPATNIISVSPTATAIEIKHLVSQIMTKVADGTGLNRVVIASNSNTKKNALALAKRIEQQLEKQNIHVTAIDTFRTDKPHAVCFGSVIQYR